MIGLQHDTEGTIDLANPVNWSHPLNRGLVWWSPALPQHRGTKWYNLARQAAPGATYGTMTNMSSGWSAPRAGLRSWGSLEFKSNTGYVRVEHARPISLLTVTVLAWVYLESYGTLATTYIRGICSKYNTPSANGYTLRVGSNGTSAGSNKLTFAASSAVADSAVFELNKWTFVAGTHNHATGESTLYKDGSAVATGNIGPALNTDPVAIGTDYLQDNRPWDGFIDGVRIYNCELSAAELRSYFAISRRGSAGLFNPIAQPVAPVVIAHAELPTGAYNPFRTPYQFGALT